MITSNKNTDNLDKKLDTILKTQEQCLEYLKFLYSDNNEIMSGLKKIESTTLTTRQKILSKPEYYSVGEIALKEGVCERTIREKIKKGHLKAYKSPGERSYRIPCDEYHKSQTEVFKI